MRLLGPLFVASALLLAGSAPAQPQREPLDKALEQARAEQASADAETARLEKAAASARGRAERLHAEQAAAAQAIDAAEARITAASALYRLAAAQVAAHRAQLARAQQPVSSLLAGLAVMARRPPLLALVDQGGTDELVKVGVLLDTTMPIIRARTRALSADLATGERLEAAALGARDDLAQSRRSLAERRERFADLEQQAIQQSLKAGGQALTTSDVSIAASEQVNRIQNARSAAQSARSVAALLASEQAAPPRPFSGPAPAPSLPFAYVLPVAAPVVEGLGAVNDSGVRSRGNRFATERGASVVAPADGVVRFSGPFRDYDGVIIIDHGNGWVSMIVDVSSPLKAGESIRLGETVGRSAGAVEAQLSHNGQRLSPALIAGSSASLSKTSKRG